MRIAIGCDDTGFPLKEPLVAALEAEGHDVLDLGTFSTDPVDYPDYARAVGQAVLRGFVDASLLLCGSGAGGVIAANKMRGIRAALCPDAESARVSREEVDANVLCLPAAGLDAKDAIEIAQTFIATQYEPSEQQARQATKIGQLEAGLLGADKAPLKPDTGDVKVTGKAATAKAAPAKVASRREAAPAAPTARPEAPAPPERPAPAPAVVNPPPVLPDPLKLPAVEETLRF
ncbi:MAG TPA: RpiB/LacA/LacB family sugar-phosphate isomerase, partial [Methylomirabilota bacterium]|nr:RpiB/LacA/LacB family sugar-phosphate isomerase [Methylomirabilota bacterium]